MAATGTSVAEAITSASKNDSPPPNFLPQRAMIENEVPLKVLLDYVFKANTKAVKEWFKKPFSKPEMILEKTSYEEGYYSKKLEQFVCVRRWRKVSPLQAAILCGDNFLARGLLVELLKSKNEKLQQEALAQLQEVWQRRIINKKSGSQQDASAPIMSDDSDSDEEDKKKSAEITEYADDAEYLAPYRKIHEAYLQYIRQYCDLDITDDGKSLTMEELQKIPALVQCWERVGDRQKELPIYALQEFNTALDVKNFDFNEPFALADIEPYRTHLFQNNTTLDKIGSGTQQALHRGICEEHLKITLAAEINNVGAGDSAGFYWLSKVRRQELKQMIAFLGKPGAAEAMVLLDDRSIRVDLDVARKTRRWAP